MKKLLSYYKELLFNTMTPTQTEHHIVSDIFSINNNSIQVGDFSLYFNGRFLIIELKNNYIDYKKINLDKIYAILTSIYSTGYFISQYFMTNDNFMENIVKSEDEFIKNIKNKNIISFKFKCEPKTDLEVKVPDKIYHITLSKNTENILKNGLLPSSGKKKSYHPHRNYFCLDINYVNDMKKYII